MDAQIKDILLRKFDLWSALSDEEYKELNVLDSTKEFKEGEYIYFEAFLHNQIYFIKHGFIRIGHLDDEGNKIVHDILQPGDFFGQLSLERSNLNGEFAQCIKSGVSLCSFTIEDFNQLLSKKPQLAIKYSKLAGLRMRRFENRILNILQKDTRTRLIQFLDQLLRESKSKKHLSPNSISIPNYLTHEEIAQLIGASRQTVTTLINQLKESGKLDYSRKALVFQNVFNEDWKAD
ncbi:MAG: Crp/Fnr family transcriptional regulator [Bacteroidetes bacterium]|nr:MAG: Crp/Fnr family transcriptional regulator [Bacteroidota bacterium]